MEKYTVEQAIAGAFRDADNKILKGKLIKASDNDFDWDDQKNFEDGDPESLHTLLSLYGQYLESFEDRYRLEKALWKNYPDYA